LIPNIPCVQAYRFCKKKEEAEQFIGMILLDNCMTGKGKSLLSEGLKKRTTEASRAPQREGELPRYDVLKGQGEDSRRSHSDFLHQGPAMAPAEEWESSEVNIDRDSPGAYSGDSARTSLRKAIGEQSGDRRRGDNSGPSRKELLKQPFNDFYDLRNHALQMTAVGRCEPQVEDAVHDLNRKGYTTQSSGFSSDPSRQQIDGPFVLDKKTKGKLKSMGVEVVHNSKEYDFMLNGQGGNYRDYTVIRFATDKNNLRDIQKEWAIVTQQIPKFKR
jgi:hypothetical protein